jgi:small conductance mechanosensitive channel
VLLTVCQADGRIYKRPEPVIGVANHGESGVVMDLKAWCKTDDYWDVKYYLEEAVKEAFDKAGITIPYPHVEARIVRGE